MVESGLPRDGFAALRSGDDIRKRKLRREWALVGKDRDRTGKLCRGGHAVDVCAQLVGFGRQLDSGFGRSRSIFRWKRKANRVPGSANRGLDGSGMITAPLAKVDLASDVAFADRPA